MALARSCAELPAKPSPAVRPLPGLVGGPSVDVATTASVRATMRELSACTNRGYGALHLLALFTDHHVGAAFGPLVAVIDGHRAGRQVPEGAVEFEVSAIMVIGGPLPSFRDEDLHVLPDGRVGALLDGADPNADESNPSSIAGPRS